MLNPSEQDLSTRKPDKTPEEMKAIRKADEEWFKGQRREADADIIIDYKTYCGVYQHKMFEATFASGIKIAVRKNGHYVIKGKEPGSIWSGSFAGDSNDNGRVARVTEMSKKFF